MVIGYPKRLRYWVVEYLEGRSHRTKFVGVVSAEEFINASIVQGSGTGQLISWLPFQN